MFYQDWTLKPSGEVFIQKVFNDWWTSEQLTSDTDGSADVRVFKGDHLVTVRVGEQEAVQQVSVLNEDTLIVRLDLTVGDIDHLLRDDEIVLSPNPVLDDVITVTFPQQYTSFDMELLDTAGRKVNTFTDVKNGDQLTLSVAPGAYVLVGRRGQVYFSKSIMVP